MLPTTTGRRAGPGAADRPAPTCRCRPPRKPAPAVRNRWWPRGRNRPGLPGPPPVPAACSPLSRTFRSPPRRARGGVPQIAVAGQAAAHGGVEPAHVLLRRPVITGREGVVADGALRGRGPAEGYGGVVVAAGRAGDGGAGARRACRAGRDVGQLEGEHHDGCGRG